MWQRTWAKIEDYLILSYAIQTNWTKQTRENCPKKTRFGSFLYRWCWLCINDDIPNIENITMPKNNRTAILRSAGIETIKVIISRLIPRAALMTRRTLKIRNTRTTRSKVGETKNAKRFSKIKPIADNIITIKSKTLNGSRK